MFIKIDYHWFYSALSQSLAALIGIVGMFIVYRLQIQEDRINYDSNRLRSYFELHVRHLPPHYTNSDTLSEAEKEVGIRKKQIETYEDNIKEIEESLKNNRIEEQVAKRKIQEYSNNISRTEDTLNGLKERIGSAKKSSNQRNVLKKVAFWTILYLCSLFWVSIVCLLFSNVFSKNYVVGIICIVETLIFLAGGLLLLIKCCAVSLDIYLFGDVQV